MVRLTEINQIRNVRYNPPKTSVNKTRGETGQTKSPIKDNKEVKGDRVRIDRYERRGSATDDKETVRQIVSLLSSKKDQLLPKPSKFREEESQ